MVEDNLDSLSVKTIRKNYHYKSNKKPRVIAYILKKEKDFDKVLKKNDCI